ncbi:MAG TPA: uroporphyrinogen-III synthase, partial [Planctomycetaceae bacterium]|nr:uroporphyrinogen-III synthase [Planctomycetaceae bacterium]
MRSLIERQGGIATVVPSMHEVPVDANPAVFRFVESLLARKFDVVVFLTGVGARILLEVAETRFERESILDALRQVKLAVRGPKPVVVLREWDVPIALRAAEPNTWRELVTALADAGAVAGKQLAIQEYGRPNTEFYDELRRRGAHVEAVPVYRWSLPEDTGPLERALQETIAGHFDVLLFTSAHQIDNVLEVAEAAGKKEAWLEAARACVVGSIGPTASEALRDSGLPVDVEAQ